MNRSQIAIASTLGVALVSGCLYAASQAVQPGGAPKAATGWKQETVISGIVNPWGLAWLPDGSALITEKRGTVVHLKNWSTLTLAGTVPNVAVIGQGGLMDISLHPDFKKNGWVYFTAATGSSRGNRTTLIRGTFKNGELSDFKTLFQVSQDKNGGQHFGSRLLWLPNKTVLMTIGDGGNPPSAINGEFTRYMAQKKSSHLGKVLCLDENGKAAKGNPFEKEAGALPEIFSYGHRNIQGITFDSAGRIWANEHGARGGDEVNLIQKGKNYGWSKVSFSKEYSENRDVAEYTTFPGMEDPKIVWTPCPAPSGLALYTGSVFPAWKGDLFSGGLAGSDIRRIDLDAKGNVIGQEQLRMGVRIRDVRMGMDGYLYALSDEGNGRLIRITPN
jgi:glucose/arabinose dehydrogenase